MIEQSDGDAKRGALRGLTVLDFSTLLPGPIATLLLAEAGARVIKIEPPGGEGGRSRGPRWGSQSASFAMLNRGKECIAVDLKDPASRDRVLKMAETADIVVEQFRPGVMDRLGLGYAALSAINPGIIFCSITGYGQNGPRALEAGHDLNYAGETGLLALSFGNPSAPVQPPAPIGDIGGGAYPAFMNILLALQERQRTGRGHHIDVSMAENIFPFAYAALAAGFSTGNWPDNQGDLITGASPRYRLYATRDGAMLVVAALEPNFWKTFCDTVALREDLRSPTADPREAISELTRIIGSQDASTWEGKLQGKDCCVTLMKKMGQAVADPHFIQRGVFAAQVADADGHSIPALPVPIVPAFRVAPSSALPAPSLQSQA